MLAKKGKKLLCFISYSKLFAEKVYRAIKSIVAKIRGRAGEGERERGGDRKSKVSTLSEGNILGQLPACLPACGPVAIIKLMPRESREQANERAGARVGAARSGCKLMKVKVHTHTHVPPLCSSYSSCFLPPLHLNFSYAQPNNIIINTFSSCLRCCCCCWEPVRHTSAGLGTLAQNLHSALGADSLG